MNWFEESGSGSVRSELVWTSDPVSEDSHIVNESFGGLLPILVDHFNQFAQSSLKRDVTSHWYYM